MILGIITRNLLELAVNLGHSLSEVIDKGKVAFQRSPGDLIAQAHGKVWLVKTEGEKPDGVIGAVSSMHLHDGTQYRLMGDLSAYPQAALAEPGLEDGCVWLMQGGDE